MVVNKKTYAFTAITITLLLLFLTAGWYKVLNGRDAVMIFEMTGDFLKNHNLDEAISLNNLLYYDGNSRAKCFVVSFKINDASKIRGTQTTDLSQLISTFEKDSRLSPELNPSAYNMMFLRNNYSLIPDGDDDSQFFPMPFSAMMWAKMYFTDTPGSGSSINRAMLFFNKKEGLFYGLHWTPDFARKLSNAAVDKKQKNVNDDAASRIENAGNSKPDDKN